MPRKPYPLETVLKHRHKRLEDQAQDLAKRTLESQQAAAESARRETERKQHAELVQATSEQELALLQQGKMHVDDLLHLQSWQVAQSHVAEEHAQRVVRALEAEQAARDQEERSRQCLAGARAEAETIQRHRDAFVAKALKREQDAAEEEAADVFAGRRKDRLR